MKLSALAINLNYIPSLFFDIASEYQFHLQRFSEYKHNKKMFHLYLISYNHKNYQGLIEEIILDNANAICVVIVNKKEELEHIIQKKELFYFVDDLYSYHQFWKWIFTLISHKIGYHDETYLQIGKGKLLLKTDVFVDENNLNHKLTIKQAKLLKLLIQRKGEIVSRITILEKIWNTNKLSSDRVLDTNIVALRKIIGDNVRNPKFIRTISGRGYQFIA